MRMMDNDEIDKECKELFEWIATWNYEVNGRHFPEMPEAEKLAIRKAMEKIDTKARADERARCIAELEKKDPYPADVFPEPTEMVCWCCRDSPRPIIASGITLDQLHGSWGRQVWNNAISALKEMDKKG